MRMLTGTVAILSSLVGVALADRLPRNAVKLTQQEAAAIYSGASSEWSRSVAYFSPDGAYLLIGKSGNYVGKGKWAVRGNEVCAEYQVKNLKDGTSNGRKDCWSWHRQGEKYWTISSGNENSVNGYYDGEIKNLSKGDKVTARYQELVTSN